jgi:hypothetical protein
MTGLEYWHQFVAENRVSPRMQVGLLLQFIKEYEDMPVGGKGPLFPTTAGTLDQKFASWVEGCAQDRAEKRL